MEKVKILNINIDNISSQELLNKLGNGGFVVTPNVDHLVNLQKDLEFYRVYNQADYVVCDSRILLWFSGILGTKFKEKISGSDFFPQFYHYYRNDETIKIFLLGGDKGVAKTAQQKINAKVGRQIVIKAHSPSFGFEKNEAECQEIVNLINQSEATVLVIGVGSPKQEKWVSKYKGQLKNIRIFLALGATINFEAGKNKRAPKWMSETGLEWLHRLLSDPKRLWKRYLVDSLPFFGLALQQKLNLYEYKQPIGSLLQQAGLLSQEQIEEILQAQAQSYQRFGDLAVQQGWIKAKTVDFFVEELPKVAIAQQERNVGHCCQAAALLDDVQIETILKEQQQVGLQFEEIAVSKGWLTPQTVNFFLKVMEQQSTIETQPIKQIKNKKLIGNSAN